MDVAAFERVYESFREFHAFFAVASSQITGTFHCSSSRRRFLRCLIPHSEDSSHRCRSD